MKQFLGTLRSKLSSGTRSAIRYAKTHKIITGIALIIVLFVGYKAYAAYAAKTTTTQYVLAAATEEPISVTVSASGEVASEHELSLSPKASGTLTSVTVKAGDTVRAGQVVATVDATDAEKTLRDARLNLESARISYQTAISSAQDTTTNSNTSLDTARDSGYDAVAKTQNDLANEAQQLKTILRDNYDVQQYVDLTQSVDPSIVTTRQTMDSAYDAAIASYQEALTQYQSASRSDSPEQTATLLANVYTTASKMSQATASALAFLQEVNSTIAVHNSVTKPTSLATNITAITALSNTAQSDANSIRSAQTSLTEAQNTVDQNSQSLSGTGGTTLNIQSAEIALQKAENSYSDAASALADYSVVAPFSGTIGSVSLQKYDTAGGSTAVATLITDAQFVNISLNETDIANVRVGQPVALTFDALEGVTATGTVAEINQVGTVSQNVATYTVKVGFTSSDTRIKPGMTAEATITTASKDNALVIPVSALKSRTIGGETQYYVQEVGSGASATSSTRMIPNFSSSTASTARMFPAGSQDGFSSSTRRTQTGATRTGGARTAAVGSVTLREVPVTIGLQSDSYVEITNGLSAGTQVVSGTLNASGTSTTQSRGLFGLFGGGNTRTGGTTRTTGAAGANASFRTTSGNTTRTSGFSGGAGGPPGGGG